MRIFIYAFVLVVGYAAQGAQWLPSEIKAYRERNFILMAHGLIERGRPAQARLILRQQERLRGCAAVHRGTGNFKSVIQCMIFLDEEEHLSLSSPGARNLAFDLNALCEKMVTHAAIISTFQDSPGAFRRSKRWNPCVGEIWRQVYLTAYANMDAHPVRTFALLRKAQDELPAHSTWRDKSMKLIQGGAPKGSGPNIE